jgi:DNA polymerase III alpha subunit (gram-positive type)
MNILFFDSETTGLNVKLNEMIQFGGIILDGRKELATIDLSFQPTLWDDISPFAVNAHKITVPMMESFDMPDVKFNEIYKVLDANRNGQRYILAGQNIKFDRKMLRAWWIKWAQPYHKQFHEMFHDTAETDLELMELTKAFIDSKLIPMPNKKLDTVLQWLRITPPGNLHNAYVDIRCTHTAFYKLVDTLQAIRKDNPNPVPDPVYNAKALYSPKLNKYLEL